jgi:peptidylprolyl isomerase
MLGLSACGSSPAEPAALTTEASPSQSTSVATTPAATTPSSTATKLPTVTGAFGTKPTVTMPGGSAPDQLVTKVLKPGKGPKVNSGDLLVVNYAGLLWNSGNTFDSSFDRGQPAAFGIGVGQVIPGWDKGLVGQTVGSRILLVIPPADGYGPTGQPQAGIKGTDTLVFVVDLMGAYAPTDSAKGKPTPTETDALPAVSVLPKKPDVTIPPGDPPGKLIAIPVVTGSGPKVGKGDVVVVQYVGKIWSSGKQFDATWDRGEPAAFGIGVGQVIPGWDKGLVGQTVGSRVLLVIPPADGYGPTGQPQAGIKGTDTLVFAVDILGAYKAS